MMCVKCGKPIPEGAAFCPFCGEKAAQGSAGEAALPCQTGEQTPVYQAEVKSLLKSGRLVVYPDRTEFVTSSVQKAVFYYTGLVAVRKNVTGGIDFITEDGHIETCPADRKCVYEALVHIEQASRPYLAQRKERLLAQGIRYSFPSSQGLLNEGVLNLSASEAQFRGKSGRPDILSYRDVKSVSAGGGTLSFTLFGGGTKSYAVDKQIRDEVLAFVTDSVAPYLEQRKADLLAQGIYFSSFGPDGGTLDIRADRAEYKTRSGQTEGCVLFQDIRAVNLYSGTLELALTDGTSRSFPVEEDMAAQVLEFVREAIRPYVVARTEGFDAVFGLDERVEFNGERGVFHFIRQGGREITGEWPMADLIRCAWTEDKNLTALGSVMSGGLGLIMSAAGSRPQPEEKTGSVNVVLTLATDGGEENLRVCFGRSTVGMVWTDKKFEQCLAQWDSLSAYLKDRCPDCELIDPVIPEPQSESQPDALPDRAQPDRTERTDSAWTETETASAASDAVRRDDLGIAHHIEGASQFIETCPTPMTIAFQGNRGRGRSSILGMLFNRMEDRHDENLYWLNARQFSKGESGEALSAQVGKALVSLLGGSDGSAAKQAGRFLTGLAGLATGMIAGDTAIGKEIAGGVFKGSGNGQDSAVRTFAKQVRAKSRGENGKAIFFIDGLDQLEPARAVELLEGMRDYFDCKGCVFVVSANYSDILRGARERYSEDKAQRYFDEMFQMDFRVPASSFNLKGYAKGKLEDMGIQAEDDTELELCAALLQTSVGKDTQSIDRLFVSFQLLKNMTGGAVCADRHKRLMLLALLCMQTRFRDAYGFAVEHRDSVTPAFLSDFCAGTAQLDSTAPTEEALAAYRDFGGVLAQLLRPDGAAEISQTSCRIFTEALELSRITSR